MSYKLVIFFTLSLPIFCSCTPDKPEIHAACETDPQGNYLLKWETLPPMEGTVKIYDSTNPDSFNLLSPIAEQDISTGYRKVFSMYTDKRTYFQLVFNKKYSIITAERIIPADGIFNLRDVGGYYANNKRETKWGNFYRSSTLYHITKNDIETLKELGIKTVIDLRTTEEARSYPSDYKGAQTFEVPLISGSPFSFMDKVISEEMKKGDVIIQLQDIQMGLLKNNTDQFIKIFDILLNENNYPALVYCALGKDRTGFITALVLAALDVPYNQILQDYMLSNNYIKFERIVPEAQKYSPEIQETLTALFSSHEQILSYVFDQINKEYGSIDNYLEKELQLTDKKREKLKDLLLYQDFDKK